jgi:hypothetical protein
MSNERKAGNVPVEVPWESIPEASMTFREVHLKLLMKEREDTLSRLVDLDYALWALEEHFRRKT